MKYVEKANLPDNAEIILIGEKYADMLKGSLEARGIKYLCIPQNPNIDARLSYHADLSVLYTGGGRIYLADYLKGSVLSHTLSELGFELIFPDITQSECFPFDADFNICIIDKLSCHGKHNRLAGQLELNGGICRQGYSRCSTCIVNEGSIITEDVSVESFWRTNGLDVLKIEFGGFLLEGFDYGFIGGCSFKLSKTELAFTGVFSGHPQYNQIIEFLDKHGVSPVILSEAPAFDIGSAIILTEK